MSENPESIPANVAAAPEKKKLGNLASRALVALVAVPILVLVIYQEVHHAIWWTLIFAASLIAMHELFAMTMKDDRASRRGALAIGAVIAAGFYWVPWQHQTPLLALVASFVLPALYYLFAFGDVKTVPARMTTTTFGIIYVGILPAFLALLKRVPEIGPDLIVLVLASAWLSDTGGYFAGKGIGGPKLYPAVSPNKTWAGSIGGVVAAAIGGAIIKLTLLDELSWLHVMMLAVPSAIIGQVGDLVESLVKRGSGVKDSGSLLPGHGGILDRIDAVIFIAPYVLIYTTFLLAPR